ncbi:hypothetical protein [Brachybacterium phenoliresistens]|uniref:Methionine synthase n=1 Tax=Brachybacterium phenoliresistens TaxID=396014 RepID=Z9JZ10_9MICO|nr:hypothetical protein [Brachybacterium phenoliresistens]EWS83036.1 hypothetical protein BF93_00265 [Brachybacterium phenoliresistens]
MSALVTLTGDGTLVSAPGQDASRLEALVALRSLLGDDLEDEIGTELYLPAALGTESADQLLPASLALLAGTSGDLTSYGWRMGPGAGRAWLRARELRARTLEDARIALLGYEGPLRAVTLGPITLAAATHLASGERTLADRGAVRDVPILLAEGILEHLRAVASHVPGAAPSVLLREDAARAVHGGSLPTPSGYRRYPALPAAEIGVLWRGLLEALASAGAEASQVRLQVPADAELLQAAISAGARSLAIAPASIGPLSGASGRRLWEALAGAREDGIDLALVVDPARAEPTLEALAEVWGRLGYGRRELAGFTLLAHRPRGRAGEDPAAEPSRDTLLTEGDLQRLLRAAPAWAERVQG